jgi:SpoU rRNA methylase family enzyme
MPRLVQQLAAHAAFNDEADKRPLVVVVSRDPRLGKVELALGGHLVTVAVEVRAR